MDTTMTISGVDLTGKRVVCDPGSFKGAPEGKGYIFRCESGFGCGPEARGSAVFGVFEVDGERCRIDRHRDILRLARDDEEYFGDVGAE